MKIICDASVATKWYCTENLDEQAKKLSALIESRKLKVIVPETFYLELANVFWIRYRKKEMGWETVLKTSEAVKRLPFDVYSDKDLTDIALNNAMIYDISSYDAVYLSLAEMYLAPLVTADKKLYKSVKDRFEFIEYLGDFC